MGDCDKCCKALWLVIGREIITWLQFYLPFHWYYVTVPLWESCHHKLVPHAAPVNHSWMAQKLKSEYVLPFLCSLNRISTLTTPHQISTHPKQPQIKRILSVQLNIRSSRLAVILQLSSLLKSQQFPFRNCNSQLQAEHFGHWTNVFIYSQSVLQNKAFDGDLLLFFFHFFILQSSICCQKDFFHSPHVISMKFAFLQTPEDCRNADRWFPYMPAEYLVRRGCVGRLQN